MTSSCNRSSLPRIETYNNGLQIYNVKEQDKKTVKRWLDFIRLHTGCVNGKNIYIGKKKKTFPFKSKQQRQAHENCKISEAQEKEEAQCQFIFNFFFLLQRRTIVPHSSFNLETAEPLYKQDSPLSPLKAIAAFSLAGLRLAGRCLWCK